MDRDRSGTGRRCGHRLSVLPVDTHKGGQISEELYSCLFLCHGNSSSNHFWSNRYPWCQIRSYHNRQLSYLKTRKKTTRRETFGPPYSLVKGYVVCNAIPLLWKCGRGDTIWNTCERHSMEILCDHNSRDRSQVLDSVHVLLLGNSQLKPIRY